MLEFQPSMTKACLTLKCVDWTLNSCAGHLFASWDPGDKGLLCFLVGYLRGYSLGVSNYHHGMSMILGLFTPIKARKNNITFVGH